MPDAGNPVGQDVTFGVITPAQITADQSAYAPAGSGSASVMRISSDQRRTLTGMGNTVNGRIMTLINVGSFPIVFLSNNASASSANRFDIGARALLPDESITLIYDGTDTKWRLFGNNAPASKSPRHSPNFYSEFPSLTGLAPFISSTFSGTLSVIASAQTSASHQGGVKITSASSANTGAFIGTSAGMYNSSTLGGNLFCEMIFYLHNTTSVKVWFGFHDGTTATEPANGSYFELAGTTLIGKNASSSTRSSTSTVATLAASNWYRLVVNWVDGTTGATFTCYNDSGAQLGTQSLSSNLTASNVGVGCVAFWTAAAATDTITIDWMSWWQEAGAFLR